MRHPLKRSNFRPFAPPRAARAPALAVALAVLVTGAALPAHAAGSGPAAAAPEWVISEWINGDPGPLAAQRGKVVLIHFFQLWCPGCNRFSIPLFETWDEKFGARDDLEIVSIHTVFEGHSVQTPKRLRSFVRDNGMTHPVGIDAYDALDRVHPVTMKRYRTGGTPHTVIVDKAGRVRFSRLGSFDPAPVESLIGRLLAEPAPPEPLEPLEPDQEEEGSDDAGDERAGKPPAPAELAGRYDVSFEQTSNSCARERDLVATWMQVEVKGDSLHAEFPKPFLGLAALDAYYDVESGLLEGSLDKAVDLGPTRADLTLEFWGEARREDGLVLIDFEFWFEKIADDPDWDCEVGGEGTATKTGP